nr:FUSC family protein [Paeniglutamicibacter kerguelensis]
MYVVAVGLAGSLATAMGWGHPYWAMASAAIPLSAAGLSAGMARGFHRVIGTYAGLVVAALALGAFTHPVFLVLLVIALQFPTELYIMRHYGLSLVFFTPLILAMTYLANPGPLRGLVLDRAAETTIGAVIGMLVLFLFMRWRREKAVTAASSA